MHPKLPIHNVPAVEIKEESMSTDDFSVNACNCEICGISHEILTKSLTTCFFLNFSKYNEAHGFLACYGSEKWPVLQEMSFYAEMFLE